MCLKHQKKKKRKSVTYGHILFFLFTVDAVSSHVGLTSQAEVKEITESSWGGVSSCIIYLFIYFRNYELTTSVVENIIFNVKLFKCTRKKKAKHCVQKQNGNQTTHFTPASAAKWAFKAAHELLLLRITSSHSPFHQACANAVKSSRVPNSSAECYRETHCIVQKKKKKPKKTTRRRQLRTHLPK